MFVFNQLNIIDTNQPLDGDMEMGNEIGIEWIYLKLWLPLKDIPLYRQDGYNKVPTQLTKCFCWRQKALNLTSLLMLFDVFWMISEIAM